MAKRGEARPYRIRFEWTGSGIKGTETRSTEEEARRVVEVLCGNADRRNAPIHVTMQHRDQPEPLLVIDYQPAPVCGHCDGRHAHNDCPSVVRMEQAETAAAADAAADELRAQVIATERGIPVERARDIVRRAKRNAAQVLAQAPKDEPW